MNWRSKKIKDSAKNEACVSCGIDDGTVVWAHSNEQKHGKGIGIKAHDLFGCFICHKCHFLYDSSTSMNKFDKQAWFREQWEKSMILVCKKGYI